MLALIMILACTENERARDWGGTVDIDVPCDHQVFDVTWKGDNFWYATQDPPKDWTPDVKHFREFSSFGLVQGEVILREHRCGS